MRLLTKETAAVGRIYTVTKEGAEDKSFPAGTQFEYLGSAPQYQQQDRGYFRCLDKRFSQRVDLFFWRFIENKNIIEGE